MLQVPQALPPESILTALINDLAQHTDELTLILDDYHLIESPTIHQGLQFLLDHQPEQLHLPLISRVDPPLPLSRLRDLFGFRKQKLLPDILLGLALFVLFVVVTYAANPLIYGPALFNTARTQTGHYNPNPLGLPLWFFWWSTLVLPVSVGITEELTYRAYALPRLVALSRRTWLAVLIVALGFSLQHVAFSLTGWQDALARFLAMFLFGLALGPLYLKIKRLLPLIIAHWLLDLIFLGLFSLIAVLTIH